jgi:hypothetical protein
MTDPVAAVRQQTALETSEELWAKLSKRRVVSIDDTFCTQRVSDPGGDFADTEIHVSAVEVQADTLLIYLTSGTVRRRVKGILRLPLGKIDLARAMAGARKVAPK